MNYLIFTYALVCVVFKVNGAIKDDHLELRQRCKRENGLASDGLAASGSSTFLQNPKAKCYLRCFLEGNQLIKADNTFDDVRSVSLINEEIREQARPLIVNCINEHNPVADRCEKSFRVVRCLHEANPGIFQQLGILEPPKTS